VVGMARGHAQRKVVGYVRDGVTAHDTPYLVAGSQSNLRKPAQKSPHFSVLRSNTTSLVQALIVNLVPNCLSAEQKSSTR
jgi:hypothetical protein